MKRGGPSLVNEHAGFRTAQAVEYVREIHPALAHAPASAFAVNLTNPKPNLLCIEAETTGRDP
jgi:hypothetical protein